MGNRQQILSLDTLKTMNQSPSEILYCNTPDTSNPICKVDCDKKVKGIATGTQTINYTTYTGGSSCQPVKKLQDCSLICPCTYSDTLSILDPSYCSRMTTDYTSGYGFTYGSYSLLPNNYDTCPLYQVDSNSQQIKKDMSCNHAISTFTTMERSIIEPLTTQDVVMNLQRDNSEFVKKMKDFNNLYYQYITSCSSGDSTLDSQSRTVNNCAINNSATDPDKCAFKSIDGKNCLYYNTGIDNHEKDNKTGCAVDCTKLYSELNKNLTDMKTNTFNDIDSSTLITKTTYDNNYNNILSDYKTLNSERNDLDIKLRELYNIPGYSSSNNKFEMDSTIYTGLVVTIIASSLVYFAFTKL